MTWISNFNKKNFGDVECLFPSLVRVLQQIEVIVCYAASPAGFMENCQQGTLHKCLHPSHQITKCWDWLSLMQRKYKKPKRVKIVGVVVSDLFIYFYRIYELVKRKHSIQPRRSWLLLGVWILVLRQKAQTLMICCMQRHESKPRFLMKSRQDQFPRNWNRKGKY